MPKCPVFFFILFFFSPSLSHLYSLSKLQTCKYEVYPLATTLSIDGGLYGVSKSVYEFLIQNLQLFLWNYPFCYLIEEMDIEVDMKNKRRIQGSNVENTLRARVKTTITCNQFFAFDQNKQRLQQKHILIVIMGLI